MKVKVGYITRWRRAIFFTLVACIVVFGLVSTVCAKLIEAALVSNMVSVAALLLCIVVFVLVLSDKWERFEGEGIAAIENGEFTYHDKKRHIEIAMDDIKSVDIKPITLGQTSKTNLAYLLVIRRIRRNIRLSRSVPEDRHTMRLTCTDYISGYRKNVQSKRVTGEGIR